MEILETLAFIHVILQVTGLTIWLLERKQWTLRLSTVLMTYSGIVIAASLTLLLYGLFGDDHMKQSSGIDVGQTVDFIQMVGIRVAHIVSITEAFVRRQDQEKFYEKVRQIDRIFECSLNKSVNNRHFRYKLLQYGSIMLAVYLVAELFILATKLISTDHYFLVFWVFYLLPLLICGIRYFQIFTLILIIKKRFETLNAVLIDLNLLQGSSQIETIATTPNIYTPSSGYNVPIFDIDERSKRRRFGMENPDLKRLLIARDLYHRLWELSTILNHGFGLSMLINLGNDFISIISNCYWIFLNFKQYSSTATDFLQIIGSAVWSVPHFFNVLVLVLLCDRTVYCVSRRTLRHDVKKVRCKDIKLV